MLTTIIYQLTNRMPSNIRVLLLRHVNFDNALPRTLRLVRKVRDRPIHRMVPLDERVEHGSTPRHRIVDTGIKVGQFRLRSSIIKLAKIRQKEAQIIPVIDLLKTDIRHRWRERPPQNGLQEAMWRDFDDHSVLRNVLQGRVEQHRGQQVVDVIRGRTELSQRSLPSLFRERTRDPARGAFLRIGDDLVQQGTKQLTNRLDVLAVEGHVGAPDELGEYLLRLQVLDEFLDELGRAGNGDGVGAVVARGVDSWWATFFRFFPAETDRGHGTGWKCRFLDAFAWNRSVC